MFQDTYKSAYHKITAQGNVSEAQVAEWIESVDRGKSQEKVVLRNKDAKKAAEEDSNQKTLWRRLY